MWPVTDRFLQALRTSHTVQSRVAVTWPDGTTTDDLPFTAGEVTVDATQPVRRSFSLELPDMDAWAGIVLGGAVLRPYRGVRYTDGTVEEVPLGVFEVRATTADVAGLTAGKITAPDRWRRVQRARFPVPVQSPAGVTVPAEWFALVDGAMVDHDAFQNLSNSTRQCPVTTWTRDRDKACEDLATAIGCEGFFDAAGRPTLRPVPDTSGPVVWQVDVGPDGVLLGGSTARTDEQTYSAVVVASTRTDGTVTFPPVVVTDTDPTSPTYAAGRFGLVPRFYSSPLLTNPLQAQAAGNALLLKARSTSAQLALSSIVNPALDAGDVIRVVLPDGTSTAHVITGLTVGLGEDADMPLTLATPAALPDEDSSG